jgi:aspartate/methionine/tyrosine aminotransferase
LSTPLSPIPPFNLERYFARWEFAAPYLLCTSDIQGWKLSELLEMADPQSRALWDELTLGYTESQGHPLLRAEIAKLYQGIDASQVITFSGAEEAIYIALRVLLRPGDHAIVTFPGYQSSYQIAEAAGAEVSRWNLRQAVGSDGQARWMLDIEDLRNMIRSNTRLILVNFPHNPTGYLPSQAQWAEIRQIAAQAGCYFFSDEVYRLLEYEPPDRLAAAVDIDSSTGVDRALSLGVMSKPFGLAGLRIGWLALHDRELYKQIAVYKDYTTICNSAPSEILALIALRQKERVLKRCMEILRTNLARTTAVMAELSEWIEWIPPQAGSIAFPRWKGTEPVEDFAERLVQAEGVLLLPGTVYDFPGGHFRYGLGRTNAEEALQRLKRYLRQSNGIRF